MRQVRVATIIGSLECHSCVPSLLISSSDAAQYVNGYESTEMSSVWSLVFFGSMAAKVGCKSSSTGTKISGTLLILRILSFLVSLLQVNRDRAEVLVRKKFEYKRWLIALRIASGSVATLHLGSHSLASLCYIYVAELTIGRRFTKQLVNLCMNGWVFTPV